MRRRHQDEMHDRLHRWLAAEGGGDDAAAEAALAAVFQRLPAPAPRAGFAQRVLVAAGKASPVAAAPPRAVRWAVAAMLAVVGSVLVLLPIWFGKLLESLGYSRFGLAEAMESLAEAVSSASHWLAEALTAVHKASVLTDSLSMVLDTPQAAAAAVAGVAVASLALRLLAQLLARERKVRYASP